MANIKHYDSLAIIMEDFDIWGGKTSLSASDFRLGDGGELPPSSIAHLGNKKIISSDHLRGFNRLKTACRRFLLRHGVPFMNGVAIPVKAIPDVAQKLDAIGAEFQSLKLDFLANYDQAVSDWVSAHPAYEDVIRRNALTGAEVANRLNFEYQVFMISESADSAQAQKLSQKVDSLGEGLIDEIAETATKMYDTHFAGKSRCGIRVQQQLQGLRDKVDGLSFLNGNLMPLVSMMDSALRLFQTASKDGFVQAPYFWEVASVVLILSQRRTIEQYARNEIVVEEMALNIQNQMAGNSVILPQAPQAAPQPAPAPADTAQSNEQSPAAQASLMQSQPMPDAVNADIEAFFARYRQKPQDQPAQASEGQQQEQENPLPKGPVANEDKPTQMGIVQQDPQDSVFEPVGMPLTAIPAVSFESEAAYF